MPSEYAMAIGLSIVIPILVGWLYSLSEKHDPYEPRWDHESHD